MLLLRFAVLLVVLSSISVVAQPARFVVEPPPGQCVDRKNIEFTLEILDPNNTEIVHAVIDTDNILIGVANTEVTQSTPNTLQVTTSVVPPAGEKVYLHVAQFNKQSGDTTWYTDTFFSSGEKNGRFLRDGSKAEGYGAPIEEETIDWKRDGDVEVFGGYYIWQGAFDYDERLEVHHLAMEANFSSSFIEKLYPSSTLFDSNQYKLIGISSSYSHDRIMNMEGLNLDTLLLKGSVRGGTDAYFYSPVFRHMDMVGLTLDYNDNFVRINPVGDSLVAQPLQAPGRTLITAVDQSVNGGFEFLSIEEGVVRFVDFNGKQFKEGPILVVGSAVAHVHQADFDNNGRVDYVIVYKDGSNEYIRVDTNGMFSTSELDFQQAGQFYVLDLDGDRFVDISTIAQTNQFGLTGIQGYGNESGQFEHYMYPAIGTELAWIDYNNDGVLTGANEEKSHYWDDPVAHARFSFADRYVDSIKLSSSGFYHYSGYTPMSYPEARSGLLTLSEHHNAVQGNSTARVSKSQWYYSFDKFFKPKAPETSLSHVSYLFGYTCDAAPTSNSVVFDKTDSKPLGARTKMDRIESMFQLDSYELLHRDSEGVLYLYYIYDNSLYAVNYNLVLQRIPTQQLLIENNVTDLLAIDDINGDGVNDYFLNREQGITEVVVSNGTSMMLPGVESLRKIVKTDANADGYMDVIGLGANFAFLFKGAESGFHNADTLFHNVDDLFVGDFDNNNLLDVLVQRHERYACQILYNFLEKDSVVALQGLWGKRLSIKDVTDDRSPELLVYDAGNQTLVATSLDARSEHPVYAKNMYQRAYSGEQFVGNYNVENWNAELLMIDSHEGTTTMYEVDDFENLGRSRSFGNFRVLDVIDANGDEFLEFIGINENGTLVVLDGANQDSPIEEVENRGNDAYQISFEDRYHMLAFLENGIVSLSSSVRGGLGSGVKESSGYSRAEVQLDGDRLHGDRLTFAVSYRLNEEEFTHALEFDNTHTISSSNTIHLVSNIERIGQELDNSTLLGYSGGTTLSLDENNSIVITESYYDRYSIDVGSSRVVSDNNILDAQIGTKNRILNAVYLNAENDIVGTSFDESLQNVNQFLLAINGHYPESCVFTKRGQNIMYTTPDTTVSVSESGLLVDVVWLSNRSEQGVLVVDTTENSVNIFQPKYTSAGVELITFNVVARSTDNIHWVDVLESEGGVFQDLVWIQDGFLRSLSRNSIPLETCPVDSIVSLACIDANLDDQIELVVVDTSGDLLHVFYDFREHTWHTIRSLRGQGYTSVSAKNVDLSPYQDVVAYRADGTVDWYSNSLPDISSSIHGDVSSRYVSHDTGEITIRNTFELCNVQPEEVSVFTEFMGTIDQECEISATEEAVKIQLPQLVSGDRVYVELLQSSCDWYEEALYRNVMFKVQGETTTTSELFPLYSSNTPLPNYGFVVPEGSPTTVGWLRDGAETNAIHFSADKGMWIGEELRTELNVQPQTDHMVGGFGARVPAFVTGVDSGFMMITKSDTMFLDVHTYGVSAFPHFHHYVVQSPNNIPFVITGSQGARLLSREDDSWQGFEFNAVPSFEDVDNNGTQEAVISSSIVEFRLKSNDNEQPVHANQIPWYVTPLHLDKYRVIDVMTYNYTHKQLTIEMRSAEGTTTQVVDGISSFASVATYDINGDGYEDVFLQQYLDEGIMLLSNVDGTYQKVSTNPFGQSSAPRFNDITGDGIPEVFLSRYHTNLANLTVVTLDGSIVSVPQDAFRGPQNGTESVVVSNGLITLNEHSNVNRIVVSNLLGQSVGASFQQVADMVTIDVSRLTRGMYWGIVEMEGRGTPKYFKFLVE